MGKFLKAVRSGEVKGPQQKGFKLATWNTHFAALGTGNSEDSDLHSSGCWFAGEFERIREITNDALKKVRWSSVRNRRLALVGFATREWWLLGQCIVQKGMNSSAPGLFIGELDRVRVQSPFAKEVDPQGVIEVLVDGLRFPLSSDFEEISTDTKAGSGGSQHLAALGNLLSAGQHYHALEQCWLDCIWNGWRVKVERPNVMRVESTDRQIAARRAVSEFRRQSMLSEVSQQAASLWKTKLTEEQKHAYFVRRRTLSVFKKHGRFRVKAAPATRFEKRLSPSFVMRIMHTPQHVEPLLAKKRSEFWGFSLSQMLDAFEMIERIPNQVASFVPQDRGAERPEDLLIWAPIFSRSELVEALRSSLQSSVLQADQLVRLMTHTGNVRDQLWFRPFIETDVDELAIVAPAIDGIHHGRLLDWLLSQLPNAESELGHQFERLLHQDLKDVVSGSALRALVSIGPPGLRFKVGRIEEEIDMCFVLGHKLFVCELKASSFPAEPLEHMHYREKLNGAAEQARRKAAFVTANLEMFLAQSGIRIAVGLAPVVNPLILSSSALFCGWEWNGVAVADKWILRRFFDPGCLELNACQDSSGNLTATSVQRFYSSPADAVSVLDQYFAHAPQVQLLEPFVTTREHQLPRFDRSDDAKFVCDFVVEPPYEALKNQMLNAMASDE